MARVLQEAFGEDPIYFRIPPNPYGWGGVMFITGDLDTVQQQIAQNERLRSHISFLQQCQSLSLPNTTQDCN
jgi:hypothetical protein